MADATEHATVVLSAIIPSRPDLLGRALQKLGEEHFPEAVQKRFFAMLERYYDFTGEVMSLGALEDMLRDRASVGVALQFTETYGLYAQNQVSDSEFLWSTQELRERVAEKATAEALTEAMTVLRTGKELNTGETLKGHLEARTFAMEALSVIDRELTTQESPEGDMRVEGTELLADYAQRKQARMEGTARGIEFGVRDLDAKVNGVQKGELVMVAGYSSDGKTTLCVQGAWSAAVEQGKNVVFFTTETTRLQVRRKLLARHSKLEMFDIPNGLNVRDLRAGTLSEPEESKLQMVVQDFTSNPSYGKLVVAQLPRGATITSMEQRMQRYQRAFNIDIVYVDYLGLFTSERKRQSEREELSSIMKEAKLVCTTFNDGAGVPIVSPWQINRQARMEAERVGMYTTAGLASTAEATNSADLVISLLAPTDNTERQTEVTIQVLKNRDGETANGLTTLVDYATSYFQSRGASQFAPAATSAGISSDAFGGVDYFSH